jgi:hypothetical protein
MNHLGRFAKYADESLLCKIEQLKAAQSDEEIIAIFARYKGSGTVKWKTNVIKVLVKNQDPCFLCRKQAACNRSCADGSMCADKFQYNHFRMLVKCGKRIQFFKHPIPGWEQMYHIAGMISEQAIKVVREDPFSRAYKRKLVKKFTR